MPKEEYGAKDLAVLEGLDAVRKRPGMYIGTTDSQGLMHCLWEIIDNSVDEALAGFCNDIVVTLHTDGSVEVADNGRGIPVDKEPKTGLSGVEVVLTKLHAGAKFGNSSYNAVGGLHGVGSSVVNALSSRLDVEVDRDGKTHHMTFHQGHPGVYTDADPANPSPDSPFKRTRKNRPTELEIIGKVSPKTTGTRIRYWYDPEIFNKTAEFSYEQLIDRVRQTSFLVPGLKITIIDENVPETAATDTVEATDDTTVEPAQDQAPALDVSSNDAELFDDSAESQSDDAESPAEEDFSLTAGDQVVDGAFGEQPAHPRVVEFLHTGGVKDFVDFLSKGEPISDIWRIQGEGTYKEETQAVGEGGELHAQEIERTCGVDIALRLQCVRDELLTGAMLFSAVFLLNEPYTCAHHRLGRILYGVLVGAITMGFRYYGVYETGVCFALLTVNSISGWMDRTESRLYQLMHRPAAGKEGAERNNPLQN